MVHVVCGRLRGDVQLLVPYGQIAGTRPDSRDAALVSPTEGVQGVWNAVNEDAPTKQARSVPSELHPNHLNGIPINPAEIGQIACPVGLLNSGIGYHSTGIRAQHNAHAGWVCYCRVALLKKDAVGIVVEPDALPLSGSCWPKQHRRRHKHRLARLIAVIGARLPNGVCVGSSAKPHQHAAFTRLVSDRAARSVGQSLPAQRLQSVLKISLKDVLVSTDFETAQIVNGLFGAKNSNWLYVATGQVGHALPSELAGRAAKPAPVISCRAA